MCNNLFLNILDLSNNAVFTATKIILKTLLKRIVEEESAFVAEYWMKMWNLVQSTRALSCVAVGYIYGSGSLNIASMYRGTGNGVQQMGRKQHF
jgi:hypothetical protein